MAQEFDEIYSLGSCCEISFLRDYYPNKSTGPFDWIDTRNVGDIIFLIHHHFRDFLEKGFNKRHRLFITSNEPNQSYWVQLYSNAYPDVFIPHYNETEFIEKSKRRIKRLYDSIRSTKRLLFIRKQHHDNTHMTSIDADGLVRAIKHWNPSVYFTLLLVNEHKNCKREPDVVTYDNVIIVDTYKMVGIRCNFENGVPYWSEIFDILEKFERSKDPYLLRKTENV